MHNKQLLFAYSINICCSFWLLKIKCFLFLSWNCKIFIKEPFDLDELLPSIGEFGKYQKLLLWFICLPACIPCGFCAFNQIFMAGEYNFSKTLTFKVNYEILCIPNATDTPHEYWCQVSELQNLSTQQRKFLSIPMIEVSFVLIV